MRGNYKKKCGLVIFNVKDKLYIILDFQQYMKYQTKLYVTMKNLPCLNLYLLIYVHLFTFWSSYFSYQF
jgi:hypothetical protein